MMCDISTALVLVLVLLTPALFYTSDTPSSFLKRSTRRGSKVFFSPFRIKRSAVVVSCSVSKARGTFCILTRGWGGWVVLCQELRESKCHRLFTVPLKPRPGSISQAQTRRRGGLSVSRPDNTSTESLRSVGNIQGDAESVCSQSNTPGCASQPQGFAARRT